MARAEPFDRDAPDVDAQFLAQTSSPLQDLRSISLIPASRSSIRPATTMREVRALDFAGRRQIYREERIADQQRWYFEKARWNDHRARAWVLVSIVLEISGLWAARSPHSAGSISVCSASSRRRRRASSPGSRRSNTVPWRRCIASQELAWIATELTLTGEERWASFVGRAEAAISREHHPPWRGVLGTSRLKGAPTGTSSAVPCRHPLNGPRVPTNCALQSLVESSHPLRVLSAASNHCRCSRES